MKIGIVARWLTYSDGVSNDVLGLAECLRDLGYEVYVFAEKHHRRLKSYGILPVEKASEVLCSKEDIIIYHFTSGWEKGMELLRKLSCKKVFRYHNVTPAEYFQDYSPKHASRCSEGRKRLFEFLSMPFDGFFCPSLYSSEELVQLGAPEAKVHVVPPFHQAEEIYHACRNERLYRKLQDGRENWLYVGRIAPHKGILELIGLFCNYLDTENADCRLILFGKQNTHLKKYTREIKDKIEHLGLKSRVLWIHDGSQEDLKACYEGSDLFTIHSFHEGFCAPLIEAMLFEVPILAYPGGAIPDTLGEAGLLLDRSQSMPNYGTDRRLRNSRAGYERYQERFSLEKVRSEWADSIQRIKDL